jgi:tetratricopeptide (TPR) repeat protein
MVRLAMREGFEEAKDALKKGRPSRAIEILRNLLAADPDNPELRVVLAEAYHRAKNDDRAFDHYHKAAAQLVARGELERGYRAFLDALALRAGEPEILFRAAECAKVLGRGGEFEQHLLALVQRASLSGDRRRLWALDELAALYPADLSVQQQRAEALAQADRLDECVDLYRRVAARLVDREADFVHVVRRAAHLAAGRPDLGAGLATLLLERGRPKEALGVVVGFYEKAPDHVDVLEVLVRCLETLGVDAKARAARVELVKARAVHGTREQILTDVDALLFKQPDDPAALEVAAHALGHAREAQRALETWRRLLRLATQRRLRAERERALTAVLKLAPEDEEALVAQIAIAVDHARFNEADELRRRLEVVRAERRGGAAGTHADGGAAARLAGPRPSAAPPPPSAPYAPPSAPYTPSAPPPSAAPSAPPPAYDHAAIVAALLAPAPVAAIEPTDDAEPTRGGIVGTQVLSDADVLDETTNGHAGPATRLVDLEADAFDEQTHDEVREDAPAPRPLVEDLLDEPSVERTHPQVGASRAYPLSLRVDDLDA